MKEINYGDDTPIAAFATTPGNSALTLIRCSGKGSIDLAASVFAPAKLKDTRANTVIHGWIISPSSEKIDETLVSVFRAPKSYTGEDSLDICCHGGPSAGAAVMSVLKSAGFREALPGEFTFRAFMNGKLDLTQSESVMELVSAKTDSGRQRAVNRLTGALFTEINEIKTKLVEILSGAELFLDYCEDEIGAGYDESEGRLPSKEKAGEVLARLKKLAASWRSERIYQEGVLTVIAGRPNAGKSSLFNLLLKEDRSIVTDTPGTTRDWIEAWLSIDGLPLRLIDTAGLRESGDLSANASIDIAEKIGMERSRMILDEADIVLYLIDSVEGLLPEDMGFLKDYKHKPLLVLWNKCDVIIPSRERRGGTVENLTNRVIKFSVKSAEGLTELYTAITETVRGQQNILTFDKIKTALGSQRQKNLVDSACAALEEALELANQNEPLDLIAPLLREAVNSLGEITGEVSTSDIIEIMFSKFCVGK
ncbi:MAG: tRNA uridine-5-carboxymethylaminomethyl(34) synthesis GTPase MnmE [Treponema sp.]|jgi:tRNA modification GTPase|nr:tRNA uridine-5-carboxymethylaminomethyl(34) synthesis GTPase MnmE [Treponema sp.]